MSCCNNNEECRFNNSTKRYCSDSYQNDSWKTYGHIPNDNHSKGCTDTLTSKSSYDSGGSICSSCCCSRDHFGDYENGLEANFSMNNKRDLSKDTIKNSQYSEKRIGPRHLFLEKM